MNKRLKKIISSISIVSMFFSMTFEYKAINLKVYAEDSSPENGIGNIEYQDSTKLAEGVYLNSFNSYSPTNKEQKGHTITFDPKTADVQAFMAYGDSVYSRKKVTSMVNDAFDAGYTTIGGVNGDFFQLAIGTGIPVGLTVQNGRLIGANGKAWDAEGAKKEDWNAIGFKKDGSVIIGNPDISLGYTVNGNKEVKNILQFNRQRDEFGVFLYTSDYSESTQTDMNSLDVVLKIVEGDVKLGQNIKCKVEKISEEVKDSAIEDGKLLLSTQVYTPGYNQLKELKLGDEINILMNDTTGKWNDVVQAIGGNKLLIKNGEIAPALYSEKYYPTTAIGIKSSGEVVIFQLDGRQPGWSYGITYNDTARYLKSIGCVDAMLFDGGGSSTMVAKLPLEEKAKIINKPSDGSERAVGNSLLLLAKSKRDYEIAKLYPSASTIKINTGESIKLDIKATDKSYYPVDTSGKLKYEISPSLGKVSSDGIFIASNNKGTGAIKVYNEKVSINIDVIVEEKVYTFEEVSKKVENAITAKTFYDYNIALYQTMKLNNRDQQAILLDKLSKIEKAVWTDDIKSIYNKLNELKVSGSARKYDEILYVINNSAIAAVDKNYLLWELTAWGKDIVWTEDYKKAMQYYMKVFDKKDKASVDEAELNILNIKNKDSREYLLEELNKLKKIFKL